MDTVTYEHSYTVGYDFDTNDVTESDIREVIKRHYDFLRWCENNSEESYCVDNRYSTDGITVSFESEEDFQHFIDFAGNYYWIFLHN